MNETVMWFICTALQLAEGFFFYRVLCSMMEPRQNRLIRIAAWISSAGIVSLVIYANDPANVTVILPAFLLVNLIGFKGKDWLLKCSVIMLLFPVIIAVSFLTTDGRIKLYYAVGITSEFMQNGLLILFYVIGILFWFLFWKYAKNGLSVAAELLDAKSWLLVDVICLASFAAVMSCVYFTPQQSPKVYPCMVACIVTNIGSVRLAAYMAESIRTRLERKNLRLQQAYYEELEKNQLQIRKFRHDMNNHFAAAGELLREGDTEGAIRYFEELSGQMASKGRRFCENGIVNALLNMKYNAAMDAGIDCFFNISIDGMMGFDDVSLCTVFANTLDNAIEACLRIPDAGKRRISAKARFAENGYFSYEIINTKINEVCERKGQFLTNKEDKKSHGLGISSVREIVERYKGTMDISYTEEEFRVVILVGQMS